MFRLKTTRIENVMTSFEFVDITHFYNTVNIRISEIKMAALSESLLPKMRPERPILDVEYEQPSVE